MNFPLFYRESNECCWVTDCDGAKLLQSLWFAQNRMGLGNLPLPAEQAADATARETLKELVRLANLEALRMGWYKL